MAIGDAVVRAERRDDGSSRAHLAVHHEGAGRDEAEADHGDLRRHHDGEDLIDPAIAQARHGDRRRRKLRGAQAPRAPVVEPRVYLGPVLKEVDE